MKKLNVDDITGFAKIAFRVADVSAMYKVLQKKNAEFKVELKECNIDPEEKFFIVSDPDGNWVQVVGGKYR